MQNEFTKAMHFRHACKRFDETRKINDEHLRFILEAGRMSPSSFGMEGWKFLVVSGEEMKAALRPLCWDQPQITTCSHLLIILTAIEDFRPESGIPAKRFGRRNLPSERIEAYNNIYAEFLKETFSSDEKTYCWGARQTYIALANMMTGAASIGIDSCPIEGFDKTRVEKRLDLDTKKWQVSVLCAFGYRINVQPEHLRLPLEEVVVFMDETDGST